MSERANAAPLPGTPLSLEQSLELQREKQHQQKLALDKAANLCAEASRELLPHDRGTAEDLFEVAMELRSQANKVLEYGT